MSDQEVKIPDGATLWDLKKLKPYSQNARTHSQEQVEQIAASMVEFGFTQPILIDEKGGIVAGHGRHAAANYLGLEKVPVIVLSHLSEQQRRAYIIADNQLALNAGWDEGTLRRELEALKGISFDLWLLGFSEEDLAKLMPEAEKCQPGGDDEAVPSIPREPVSRLGDFWVLGKHRLLVGDSTGIDAVEKLMGKERADLIFTDPPYNVNYTGKTKESLTIENDQMDGEQFYKFLYAAFTNMFWATKPGAGIYVAHASSEAMAFMKAMTDAGFLCKQQIIWVKQTLVMGRQDYHWQHEPILYGWNGAGSHTWYGDRKQTTVWNVDKPNRNAEHPTMKPIELMEKALNNSSERSQIVLDLFGGSGSTLIACEKLGRKCRTMELDPRYADVIVKRWQDFSGKLAVLDSGESFEELEKIRNRRQPGKKKTKKKK